MTRADGRAADQLRPVEIIPNFTKFAEGSVLIRCGDTVVLCNASVEDKTPPHVAEGCGWVTAEYSMLPRANRERSRRKYQQHSAPAGREPGPPMHCAQGQKRDRKERSGQNQHNSHREWVDVESS